MIRPASRLALALSAGAALWLLADSAPAQRQADRAVAYYKLHIEEQLEHGQLDEAWFDTQKVLDEIAYRTHRGVDQQRTANWLQEEMGIAFYSFAKPGARHSDRTRYRLPFDAARPRQLILGIGVGTHRTRDHFAFDFAMPTGTPVLAARSGTVARVVDGYTEGGLDDPLRGRDNAVLVLHTDGSFARYGHLSPGIPVAVGAKVEVGQLLARSGNTGWSEEPHLHFAVYVLEAPGARRSRHITFSDADGNDFVPTLDGWYPTQPDASPPEKETTP